MIKAPRLPILEISSVRSKLLNSDYVQTCSKGKKNTSNFDHLFRWQMNVNDNYSEFNFETSKMLVEKNNRLKNYVTEIREKHCDTPDVEPRFIFLKCKCLIKVNQKRFIWMKFLLYKQTFDNKLLKDFEFVVLRSSV